MHRGKCRTLIVVAVAFVGVGLLAGCAPDARPTAPEATAPAPVDVEEVLQRAEDAFAAEEYEQARALFEALGDVPEHLSEQQWELVHARIQRIDSILHERAVAEREPVDEEPPVEEVEPPAVEEPTEPRDVLSEQERVRLAQEHFELGMGAYERNEYPLAAEHLRAARDLDVSLGWRRNRRLPRTLEHVEDELSSLRAAYQEGKAAFENEQFEEAVRRLGKVAESDVRLEPEVQQDVSSMLAESRRLLAARRVEELAAAEREALELAQRAETIRRIHQRVADALQEADRAMEAGRMQRAEELLNEAAEVLQRPEAEGVPVLAGQAEEVQSRLATIRQWHAEQERQDAVRRRVDEKLAEAESLLETDALAAEQKAEEAASLAAEQDVPLTEQQRRTHDAVMADVEAEFGLPRRVVRSQSEQLLAMSAQYQAAGEFSKAVGVLSLVRQAPAALAPDELRAQAAEELETVSRQADEQEQLADSVISKLQRARRLLDHGDLQAARQTFQETLAEARAADLSGQPAISAGSAARDFLAQDFAEALTEAAPDHQEAAAEMLRQGRHNLALVLSRHYLDSAVPAAAEPHLRLLVEQGPAEAAAWAGEQLDGLERLKEYARQEQLLAVEDELRRVRELAGELAALVEQGRMDAAAGVEQKLADARVRAAVARARDALDAGAWQQADDLLAEAPVETAERALVQRRVEPLRQSLQKARAAARDLDAAERAIAEGELEDASYRLEAVWQRQPLPETLTLKAEMLAGVLEPVRDAMARQMELENWRGATLREVEDMLAHHEQREQGWEEYFAAAQHVMSGELEEARAAFSELLAAPEGLIESELANAREVVAAVADTEAAVEEAHEALARLRALVQQGDYARAADALETLRRMEGFALEAQIQQQAAQFEGHIREAERRADELYRAAVRARQREDVDRLRELLRDLRSDYSGTRVFQERL